MASTGFACSFRQSTIITQIQLQADLSSYDASEKDAVMDEIVDVVTERARVLDIGRPIIERQNNDQILLEISGYVDNISIKQVASRTILEFGELVNDNEYADYKWETLTGNFKGKWKPATGVIDGQTLALTSLYIEDAYYSTNNQYYLPMVVFNWDVIGSQLSEQITSRLVDGNQPLGIFSVDGPLVDENNQPITPMVQGIISNGGQIQGLSQKEAKQLAELLKASQLPVSLSIRDIQIRDTSSDDGNFTSSVPLPGELSKDPKVVGTNLGLALVTVLLFYFSATLFNNTIKENYNVIQGYFVRFAKQMSFFGIPNLKTVDAYQIRNQKLPSYIEGLFVVGLCAIIYWFLDPYFTNSLKGISLFIALALGIAIATLCYDGTQVYLSSHKFIVPAAIRVYPLAALIAIVFVIVSKVIDFHPGIIFGFVGAYAAISTSRRLNTRQEGLVIFYGTLVVFIVSIGAFLLRDVLYKFSVESGGFLQYFIDDVLVAGNVIGLEGIVFSLIPIAFSDGAKLKAWNFWVWFAVSCTVTFSFYYIFINKDGTVVQALTNVRMLIAYVLVGITFFTGITTWVFFTLRRRKPRDASKISTTFQNEVNNTEVKTNITLPITINPKEGIQGKTLDIVITGSKIDGVTSIHFGSGITLKDFTIINPNQISIQITISFWADLGSREVLITSQDGASSVIGKFDVQVTTMPSIRKSGEVLP
jgi:hypothetical protein